VRTGTNCVDCLFTALDRRFDPFFDRAARLNDVPSGPVDRDTSSSPRKDRGSVCMASWTGLLHRVKMRPGGEGSSWRKPDIRAKPHVSEGRPGKANKRHQSLTSSAVQRHRSKLKRTHRNGCLAVRSLFYLKVYFFLRCHILDGHIQQPSTSNCSLGSAS
jgi:hypothetical protein